MSEQRGNFYEAEKEIMSLLESYLLRNYLKKRKPHYLIGIIDSHKLEATRKTISEIEVFFLDTEPDNPCDYAIDKEDPRENDLKNHFPSQANKFINYRKEENERERNEVPARKTTFFWQRGKNN